MREYDLGRADSASGGKVPDASLALLLQIVADYRRAGVDLGDPESVDAFITAWKADLTRRLSALIRQLARQHNFVVARREATDIPGQRMRLIGSRTPNGPNCRLAAPCAVGSLA